MYISLFVKKEEKKNIKKKIKKKKKKSNNPPTSAQSVKKTHLLEKIETGVQTK